MRNFLKIAEGADVTPLRHAIQTNPDLWDKNTLRTAHPESPHTAVSDMWVFFNAVDPLNPSATIDAVQTFPYEAWSRLPQLRPLVFDILRRVEGTQLGRVLITRLPPGKEIPLHVDEGAPATFFTRYHLAVQNRPGSLFRIEDEVVQMKPGELWLVNNCAEHGVVNNSDDDRIVLILDIRLG